MKLLFGIAISVALVMFSDGGTIPPDPITTTTTPPPVHDSRCDTCEAESCKFETGECDKYVVCLRQDGITRDNGLPLYTGTDKECPFGTMFAKDLGVCDATERVACPNDPCNQPPYPAAYQYRADNCMAYYSCNNKRISMPKCCGISYRFDGTDCVKDATCSSGCPARIDRCPDKNETTFVKAYDSYCMTYESCSPDAQAYPFCCDAGSSFDSLTGSCVADASCSGSCPYPDDQCRVAGVSSYKYKDEFCATHVVCGATVAEDFRACCKPGYKYDSGAQKCVEMTGEETCDEYCPDGFEPLPDCPLSVVADDPYSYMSGTIKVPCPGGTVFSALDCTCVHDPDSTVNTACQKAIDIRYNITEYRFGSQSQADLAPKGTPPTQGAVYGPNGEFAGKYNGYSLGIPYSHQTSQDLYIVVSFVPPAGATTMLVSNCGQYSSQSGTPSVSAALFGTYVRVNIITNKGDYVANIDFQPGVFNTLTVIKSKNADGVDELQVFNEYNAELKSVLVSGAAGDVLMGESGLSIGGCEGDNKFVGDVALIAYSPCVVSDWTPGTVAP